MELRVYRTFRWVHSDAEIRFGVENPMRLHATEELQYRDADGAWQPIEVVEAARPEHPREAKRREEAKRTAAYLDEIMANVKCGLCGNKAHYGEPCPEPNEVR